MEFSLKYDRLVSLAVSAMLTASFLATAPGTTISAAAGPQPAAMAGALEALRAAGWQGVKGMSIPAPVASPTVVSAPPAEVTEKPSLSDAQLEALSRLLVKYGLPGEVKPNVANALGLTKPGESLPMRELNTTVEKKLHAYHVIDGGYLLYAIYLGQESHIFRVNSKQELVASIKITPPITTPVVIPVADAQKELKDELTYWAGVADRNP